MKIVHFAKFYPPEFGGIESVTQALAADHSSAGHDVHVICFTQDKPRRERVNKTFIRRCKTRILIASQPLSLIYVTASIWAARNADVVHVHFPNFLAALAVLALPRSLPVLVHWHADVESKGALGRLVRPLERALLGRANVVVCTSRVYAEASKPLKLVFDRVRIVPIGISDQQYKLRCEYPNNRYVLYIGRLVAYKGLDYLLEAVHELPKDVGVIIVGTGPQEKNLKNECLKQGISHRVKFLGRVGTQELDGLLAGAALFCLPSVNRLEAFGVVLLEAMRAGRAIVATDIPGSGVPWVNTENINVPPRDSASLAAAINVLLHNPDLVEKLGELSRKRFELMFKRSAMSASFLDLYEMLAARQ